MSDTNSCASNGSREEFPVMLTNSPSTVLLQYGNPPKMLLIFSAAPSIDGTDASDAVYGK